MFAERPPFNEHFFSASQLFMKELLKEIPELQGMCIVPTWHVPQEHLPWGISAGQRGPLEDTVELTRMTEALLNTGMQHFRNLQMAVRAYDEMMAALAGEISVKQEELKKIEERVNAANQELTRTEEAL
jgi:hypothetical protein